MSLTSSAAEGRASTRHRAVVLSALCVCVCVCVLYSRAHGIISGSLFPLTFSSLSIKQLPPFLCPIKNFNAIFYKKKKKKKDVSAILSLRPCRPPSCTQYFRESRTAAAVQRQCATPCTLQAAVVSSEPAMFTWPVLAERAPNTSVLCHQEAIWTRIVTISISRGVRCLSQAILLCG